MPVAGQHQLRGPESGGSLGAASASFTAGQRVFDTIYQPPLTAFLAAAKAAGAETANGASMLLHQGIQAFRLWFPDSDPAAAMRRGLAGG